MTVVIDEQGEGHAVLMVRTDRGDFILDNKRMERPAMAADRLRLRQARGPRQPGLDFAQRRDLADRDREPLTAPKAAPVNRGA